MIILESTKRKHLAILEIYEEIVKESGKYACYLSRTYFVMNTVLECQHRGIKEVSRSVVYSALRNSKQLKKEKHFILNGDK